ncbi:hypothetical protein Trco_005021 [Trichoderma cornu-damae]|uniref:Uncharacterized protein n=1 Tax=Trichoderma cornu-damae TaxID=654480 RepID=A0A9P8QMN6_9HYPO|nr:hypothetical protein Trco_005021 [Trichoderma cornu-damae]
MVPRLEMLRLQDDGSHPNSYQSAMEIDSSDDQESDGESTVVPGDWSVARGEVIDLTIDGNHEGGIERQLNEGFGGQNAMSSAQGSTSGNRSESPLSGSESSLFMGTEPGFLRQAPSSAPTRRQSSLAFSTGTRDGRPEVIDLTGSDDLLDNFLPSENLTTSPDSRKRLHLKVETKQGDSSGDADASGSAKRLRISPPEQPPYN